MSPSLNELVDQLLAGDAPQPEAWPAVMVPHAGLIYSGRLAADVLRRVKIPETVIVIGPKHTPHGVDWAVAPNTAWSIPGATLAADPQLARQLVEAIPGLELDAAAHQQEHAIEVELPFLARLAPTAKVVGIAIGAGDLATCRQFADGLARVISRVSGAAAAGDLQRHEPLRHRCGEPPSGRDGPGRDGEARPRAAALHLPAATTSACAACCRP